MDVDIYHKMRALEAQHWWFSARRKYIDQLIRRCVDPQPGARFLEVGAGSGGNLALLGQHARVDAVEYDQAAVTMIRERALSNIDNVSEGSLPDRIPFEGPYDAVFALDVVEHVEDDAAALATLGTLIGEDGRLVLTVPAYQWLWSGHDVVNQHFRRYNLGRFVRLIESAGLEISFASYFNTLLFPLKLLQHVKERLSPPKQNAWQVTMPSLLLNSTFESIFSLEQHLAGRITVPFGLSIAVVARRPAGVY